MRIAKVRFCWPLVAAFLLALLYPDLAKACSCESSSSSCTGDAYCTYCNNLCMCFDTEPVKDPCDEQLLAYNATHDELTRFKERINAWSKRQDLQPVVEAATELYSSVFFQDSQSFLPARDKFGKAIDRLPEEARKSL